MTASLRQSGVWLDGTSYKKWGVGGSSMGVGSRIVRMHIDFLSQFHHTQV